MKLQKFCLAATRLFTWSHWQNRRSFHWWSDCEGPTMIKKKCCFFFISRKENLLYLVHCSVLDSATWNRTSTCSNRENSNTMDFLHASLDCVWSVTIRLVIPSMSHCHFMNIFHRPDPDPNRSNLTWPHRPAGPALHHKHSHLGFCFPEY